MLIRNLLVATLLVELFHATTFGQSPFTKPRRGPTGVERTLVHAGRVREYRLHVPAGLDADRGAPLVLFLHGGGGTADLASRMGMTPLADLNGFVVVYPNAIDHHWHDGREVEWLQEQDVEIDDVGFLALLVEQIAKECSIDRTQVFAAGASNGGFMCQRLAMEKPEVFSAVAVIVSTMAASLPAKFHPSLPVSVIFMNGTEDPAVPYEGGQVAASLFPRLNRRKDDQPGRGRCISTDEAVSLWLQRDGLHDQPPTVTMLPDIDQNDGCHIERRLWTGGTQGTSVALYKVVGGGHTVPGGQQYLPARLIGNTNRDIDGLDVIWKFFVEHHRSR